MLSLPSYCIPLYKEFKYAYANGRVWALENKLIGREKLLRIAEAENIEEAVRLLSETEYAELLKNTANIDEALEKIALEFYAFLSSFFPDKEIINALSARYKLYSKKIFSKFKEEEIENRIIEIDRKILNEKLELNMKVKSSEEVLKSEIDLINLRILLRAKKLGKSLNFLEKALLEGGRIKKEIFLSIFLKEQSRITDELSMLFEKNYGEKYKTLPKLYFSYPSYFDRECDNLILEKIHDFKKIILGPESLIAYIYEKENEIKNLGIVLKAKLFGIEKEEIKKMLRG